MALKFDRYERNPLRELDQWLGFWHPKLGLPNVIALQRYIKFTRCLISIILSYHLLKLANEDNSRLGSSTNPHQLADDAVLIHIATSKLRQP